MHEVAFPNPGGVMNVRMILAVLIASLVLVNLLFYIQAKSNRPQAELILANGKIVTMDAENPTVEAVAVTEGKIISLGTTADIVMMAAADARIIDLDGRTVVPGLIESHAHLSGIGEAMTRLDLVGTESEEQIAAMVRERAVKTATGRWILGRGWDQNDWKQKSFPSFESLTDAAPDNPVCLTRIDGHAVWVNRAAMDLCGLTAETADPSGGRIVRDGSGNPTGILVDAASNIVESSIPPLSREELKAAYLLAIKECNANGFTSFHDAGAGSGDIAILREILAEGNLTLRLNIMLHGSSGKLLDEYFSRGPVRGEGDGFITIRSVKLFADGALGSRGAALLEDYSDEPGNKGLVIETEDRIHDVASRALESGFQVCTHAIGDRANRITLDAYERAFEAHPEARDPRFRIEHAQILDEADIPRFAALGVIAAMQAQHCTSDMPWAPTRIGAQRAEEGAYVWQKLLRTGTHICNGSDAPVESMNPFWGIHAAVTRRGRDGIPEEGWSADQCMTRDEALASFTIEGAYASFEEDIKGRIREGYLADLTVLSNDIMTCPEDDILETRALMTIVGGKVVFEQEGVFQDL
jgi:predicted amidohydrolase YtcJ